MNTLPAHISILSSFDMADTRIQYLRDEHGTVGLMLFPIALEPALAAQRETMNDTRAWNLDSLVQLKIAGDVYPALFCQGKTMRNGSSVSDLRFQEQTVEREGEVISIRTKLQSDRCECEHFLSWRSDEPVLEARVTLRNSGERPLTLEMLASFSLGGLTPFAPDDASEHLRVHRLQSAWCAEGGLQTDSLEELQLESFHYGNVASAHRFGQVGSMPVRGWFPFVAVEDASANAFWGAQLACSGSWQMELYRRDDKLCVSGGVADRELGHWTKTLAPGDAFTTPTAVLATVQGDLETLCARLLQWQERAATLPIEADLPIAFNEWCTTWGNPTHKRILAIADRLQNSEVRYLVMDAGWYVGHGDWLPNMEAFPHGLEGTTRALRERGLIPGLWFEIETCEPNSRAYHEHSAHQLHRDGVPLQTATRRFWDFRDSWTSQYLSERVIALLERCDIGYLKIDYNDCIGIGADGAESQGEALRQHLAGVHDFWKRIRERLPHLVIENCASGGHRLEPAMMSLCDQASFSDAHELSSIPIIAANLHRAILPRKSQIWAVLRQSDDARRLTYSLCATFLGRMCLSGDIEHLSAAQWDVVQRGQKFYREAWPVVRDGFSRRFGPDVSSYRHPTGWQAVLRFNPETALIVCHAFDVAAPGEPLPERIQLELPPGEWHIAQVFGSGAREPQLNANGVACFFDGAWSACAVLLSSQLNSV